MSTTEKVTLIATAAMGIESIVAKEVKALGYDPKTENGRVIFEAPIDAIPRCNLWLRTADRVRLVVGQFTARTFDELFEKTKALDWERYIPEDGAFPVAGKSVKSGLFSVRDCQAIVKKAIVDKLKYKYGIAHKMPETGSLYKIEVALLKDVATLTIDTSGVGLHKRGYRVGQGDAPLKETLAAALIQLTNWRPSETFVDPFCGSGTIPIEAALIGQNIAPGFNRSFASEDWSFIPETSWELALEEVEDLANYDQPLSIIGSDIDSKVVGVAKENAIEAGLGDLIKWDTKDVANVELTTNNGYIVTNPPYGERIGSQSMIEHAYKSLGKKREANKTWSMYILTAYKNFEKVFGETATKRRKLFNGFIEAHYYQYFGQRKR